jgi:DNA-binding transcriptional MerR regulator
MVENRMLAIGDLARETGTKVQTIRWYEEVGVLPPAIRTAGNQRRYDRRHLERLGFVRHARELGFPLAAIRELLALADHPEASCTAADSIARRQLQEVRSKIARLQALEREFERMIDSCGQGCIGDCRVIEVLADRSHGHCLSTDHHHPRALDAAGADGADRRVDQMLTPARGARSRT